MRKEYYFVLSGNSEHLALAELKALLEAVTGRRRISECYTMICTVEGINDKDAVEITSRAGFIRESGRLLGTNSLYDEPLSIDLSTYRHIRHERLKSINPATEIYRHIKRFILKNKVPNKEGDKILRLLYGEGLVFYGELLAVRDTRSFYRRRPSIRPFFRSIALSVSLSRAMVNLARTKPGDIVLDPFAGTGSILLEAGLMGMKPVGVEIDWVLVHGAKRNLDYYKVDAILILGDSTVAMFNRVDAIVTDPPYGRAASTRGVNPLSIYKSFIRRSSEVLDRKSYLVFLSPHYYTTIIDEELCKSGFIIRDKIFIYVHGGLTRVLYVAYKP